MLEGTIESYIRNHPSFTTAGLTDDIRKQYPNIGRSTIYSILKKKRDVGEIAHVGKGLYMSSGKQDYRYELSDTAKESVLLIREEYPLIDFQVWELYQMNEFVNHQLSRNTVIIETETMLDETVFNLLFEHYPHVLHSPTLREYYKYAGDETIVVGRLISEAPQPFGEYRQASLEKILVDLFGHGITGSFLPRSEYVAICEDSFRKYNINRSRMFRYARRRGIEKEIRTFLQSETDIVLEGV